MGLQWSPVKSLNNFSCKAKFIQIQFEDNVHNTRLYVGVCVCVCVFVKCMRSHWCVNKLRLEDEGKKTKHKHFNL